MYYVINICNYKLIELVSITYYINIYQIYIQYVNLKDYRTTYVVRRTVNLRNLNELSNENIYYYYYYLICFIITTYLHKQLVLHTLK